MGFSSAASLGATPSAPAAREAQPPRFPAAGLSSLPDSPPSSPSPRRDPSSSRGLAALSPLRPPPPRGWLPTSAPPGRTPPGPLCTWGCKGCTPAPQRRLFCRRSAAAPRRAPAPSPRAGAAGSDALPEWAQASAGLGGPLGCAAARARPARLSGLGPRPKLQSSRLRAPRWGGLGPAPAPAPRLGPLHSLPLQLASDPAQPRPELQPFHSAPVCRVQAPQLRPLSSHAPRTESRGFMRRAVGNSSGPTSPRCTDPQPYGPWPANPSRWPLSTRPRPYTPPFPLLSSLVAASLTPRIGSLESSSTSRPSQLFLI